MSVYYQALMPTPLDGVETPTSDEQVEVEQSISSVLHPYQKAALTASSSSALSSDAVLPSASAMPVPALNKSYHLAFLRKVLDPLPSAYVGFDTTRCWLIFWVAHSYYLMGTELSEPLRSRAISTLLHFQDRTLGGFGSGKGQFGHLMASYATVMALAIVGGPGPCPDENDIKNGQSVQIGKGGWDDIDRPLLYRFLLSLKQPDGSFFIHRGGEIDVRTTYCICCISLILGIGTPELFQGVGDSLARCQTYEGGLCASNMAFGQDGEGAPFGEAHGGYTYCALASHLSLTLIPNPQNSVTPPFSDLSSAQPATNGKATSTTWNQQYSASCSDLDVDAALRWAVAQQGIAIEGGGFRGRTNKLVDGCYGWYCGGGMFTIMGALQELRLGQWWKEAAESKAKEQANGQHNGNGNDGEWENIDEDSLLNLTSDGVLFDRVALQEYILLIAQAPKGGLRDKPGKNADAYHTCYNLSGLSLCQHRVELDPVTRSELYSQYKLKAIDEKNSEYQEWQRSCYAGMLGWTIDPKYKCVLGGSQNQVGITHPVFNVGFSKAKTMMDWAYNQL